MGLQLFFALEEPIISMPKESHAGLFQYEDQADYVFRHSCNYASHIYPMETACELPFLLGYFALATRRYTAKMP
jgi:hypothetical protein